MLKILLVEDNPGDAELVKITLQEEDLPAVIEVVDTIDGAVEYLKKTPIPDVVLLDLNLPDSHGLDTVRRLVNEVDAPIVVITGLPDHDLAVTAIRLGAQDYVDKGELTSRSVVRSIFYAIERYGKTKLERALLNDIRLNLSSVQAKLEEMIHCQNPQ